VTRRIFLAGASGAIGRRLIPLLLAAGHEVIGTTRSPEKAKLLSSLGIVAAVVDVFDVERLEKAMVATRPDVVVHQLTDLPPGLDPARMAESIVRNARVRREGTHNLVAAALAAGAGTIVAQSIAWAYAPGPLPHRENDPLDLQAEGSRSISVRGVAALEDAVLGSRLDAVVLRYGHLYGPGTGADTPPQSAPVHVDAAAFAALLAIEHNRFGAFNIAEPNPEVSSDKAIHELKWRHTFRLNFADGADESLSSGTVR
jgi:nucleoside-diphosphate-sugar epimerase